MGSVRHLLCVDLESWVFSKKMNEKNLSVRELRALDGGYTLEALDYLLRTLRRYDQTLTFFVVTKLEELYPGMLQRILDAGHEVGWHTHSHEVVENAEVLRRQLEQSEKVFARYPIRGFQAPSVTFGREGYRVLKDYGFLYSSSVYGNTAMLYDFDGVYEIPVSTAKTNVRPKPDEMRFPSDMRIQTIRQFGIPYGSSFFWAIAGPRYYARKLREAERESRICNLFIHEWQLVTPQSAEYRKDISVMSGRLFSLFFLPYRVNMASMFEYLLAHYSFGRCIDYLNTKVNLR